MHIYTHTYHTHTTHTYTMTQMSEKSFIDHQIVILYINNISLKNTIGNDVNMRHLDHVLYVTINTKLPSYSMIYSHAHTHTHEKKTS